jgi:spore coat protein CotH
VRSGSSTTSLNDALALDLNAATKLKSQLAIPTSFSVNGSEPVLRLAVEHPDDDAWQERSFDSPGALYKAESTGDWSYRGDDPDSYAEIFDQEGGKKVADLTPLIEFLQFINESDDQAFAEELPERLDVESFATYLALMELLNNFDDIDGPGNNAYLWWDADSEQFAIVPWDMNLAFGQFGGRMGAGPPGGFAPNQMPEGAQPPGGEGRNAGGGFGPRFGRDNVLVQRFLANAEFHRLYQDQLANLRADLFANDTAETLLDARVEALKSAPGVIDSATVESEASDLRGQFAAASSI